MQGRLDNIAAHAACRRLAWSHAVGAVRAYVARQAGGVVLESASAGGGSGRYSIFALDPVRTVGVADDGLVDPLAVLASAWRPWLDYERPAGLPFVGGWIGWLGYEAGRWLEPTAGWHAADGAWPVATWSLYDTVVVHDAADGAWYVAGVEMPTGETPVPPSMSKPPLRDVPSLDGRMDALAARVDRGAAAVDIDVVGTLDATDGAWGESDAAYLDIVERCIDYIYAGDIFQVNVARRYRARLPVGPAALFDRLCRCNPAAYAAYLPFGDGGAVLSSSPELFLDVQGREVTTRPIKGTRPRGADGVLDAAMAAALSESEKDRAELNMIIDLERNDLGRVCEYGSIRVASAGRVEAHPTVFHRVAEVRGRMRADTDVVELLRATFPGGSITGAPKVRAMEIIQEMERVSRGPYCGAIGYVGLDGDARLNLGIRTLVAMDDHVSLWVGSGIVADSTPEDEADELKAKAAGMMAALFSSDDGDRTSLALQRGAWGGQAYSKTNVVAPASRR